MPSWNKITLCVLMNYHITLPFSIKTKRKRSYSLFYKLNFVSRRQFFINIWDYPSKCKKCEMTHFWATKSLKGGHFFWLKTISLKTCTLTRTFISFKVQFYKKSILPHKWDTFGTDSMLRVISPFWCKLVCLHTLLCPYRSIPQCMITVYALRQMVILILKKTKA